MGSKEGHHFSFLPLWKETCCWAPLAETGPGCSWCLKTQVSKTAPIRELLEALRNSEKHGGPGVCCSQQILFTVFLRDIGSSGRCSEIHYASFSCFFSSIPSSLLLLHRPASYCGLSWVTCQWNEDLAVLCGFPDHKTGNNDGSRKRSKETNKAFFFEKI